MAVELLKENIEARFGKLCWELPKKKAEPVAIL